MYNASLHYRMKYWFTKIEPNKQHANNKTCTETFCRSSVSAKLTHVLMYSAVYDSNNVR